MVEVFTFRPCGVGQLDKLLEIEAEALSSLDRPDLLRRNTISMWLSCLQPPHLCLGAWAGEELAGFAVLYVPEKGGAEDLAQLLASMDAKSYSSANYKICIVRPSWRGHHLQVQLGKRIAAEAKTRGISLLCATASPFNTASVKSLLQLGYREDSRLVKYGFERILFYQIN